MLVYLIALMLIRGGGYAADRLCLVRESETLSDKSLIRQGSTRAEFRHPNISCDPPL